MGISQWASPTVPPPQSAPSADPPSTLPGPSATPPAVLALLLSLRNGKSEGGTAIGTVENVTLAPEMLPSPPPPPYLTCFWLPQS